MFGLGMGELLLILVFALLFIGPKKLPGLAKGLGNAIREFQRAKDQITSEMQELGPESKGPKASSPAEGERESSL